MLHVFTTFCKYLTIELVALAVFQIPRGKCVVFTLPVIWHIYVSLRWNSTHVARKSVMSMSELLVFATLSVFCFWFCVLVVGAWFCLDLLAFGLWLRYTGPQKSKQFHKPCQFPMRRRGKSNKSVQKHLNHNQDAAIQLSLLLSFNLTWTPQKTVFQHVDAHPTIIRKRRKLYVSWLSSPWDSVWSTPPKWRFPKALILIHVHAPVFAKTCVCI